MSRSRALPLALSGMLALAVAIGIGRFAFTPILPMMQLDYGVSLRLAGLLASANYVGYFAGALAAIWIRTHTVSVVRLSLAAVIALTAAMAAVHHPAAWLLLRGLAGMASAWILIFASAYILERLAALGASRLAGVVFSGVGFGIALSGLVCLQFVNQPGGADRTWMALAAAALMLTALCWAGYRDATRARAVATPGGTSLRLREHALILFCYAILGFGYIIPATFLPAMARRIVADPAAFGWAWPIFGATALISTLLVARLSARWSNRSVWALSHGVMAAGVAMPVLLPGMAGILIAACCVGGTFMVATMTGLQEARVCAPDHAPRLIAAMTTAFALGQIAGPLLVSLLANLRHGIDVLLLATAALLVASAACLAAAPARRRVAD